MNNGLNKRNYMGYLESLNSKETFDTFIFVNHFEIITEYSDKKKLYVKYFHADKFSQFCLFLNWSQKFHETGNSRNSKDLTLTL